MNIKKIKIYNKKYEKIIKIGEGTYGKVMLVTDIHNNSKSDPKKIEIEEEKTLETNENQLKIQVFAIKKSKEAQKNQNIQVFH